MKIRPIITGLLVLAAIGGIVFALTGGQDETGEAVAEATANPARSEPQETVTEAAPEPARTEPQETVTEATAEPARSEPRETVTEAAPEPARTEPQGAVDPAAAINLALQDELPADGVVVYYFHGRQRCYTCNKMETLADAAVHETFADYLDDGLVVFRAVNIQTPENNHFAHDFELRSAGIVMVERLNGEQLRWHRLDEVWQKVRNDDAFKSYIVENLSTCLRELGLEKS